MRTVQLVMVGAILLFSFLYRVSMHRETHNNDSITSSWLGHVKELDALARKHVDLLHNKAESLCSSLQGPGTASAIIQFPGAQPAGVVGRVEVVCHISGFPVVSVKHNTHVVTLALNAQAVIEVTTDDRVDRFGRDDSFLADRWHVVEKDTWYKIESRDSYRWSIVRFFGASDVQTLSRNH